MVNIKNGKMLDCEYCSKKIYRRPSEIKKSKNIFCSLDCAYSFKKGKPMKNKIKCIVCNNDVNSRGLKRKYCSKKCRSEDFVGTKHTLESKKKISTSKKICQFGDKNPAWKGGVTPKNNLIRTSLKMKEWRKDVFKRDNYKCQNIHCELKTTKIVAHHILKFSEYPLFRFSLWNGLTLCEDCHKEVHAKVRTKRIQFKNGSFQVTKVYKIEITKQEKDNFTWKTYEEILDKDSSNIYINQLAKKEGFKSSEDMFDYFDKSYSLETPKEFYVYEFKWL